MNQLIVKGKITKIFEPEIISGKDGKTWKKQNFLVNTGAQFNAEICFQLFGEEKIKILENFNTNDNIDVYFNLSSKKFNDRYFHNIDAWKIEKSNTKNTETELKEDKTPF